MITAERASMLQDYVLQGNMPEDEILTEEEQKLTEECSAVINGYMDGLKQLINSIPG